jgi:prolipoprotein diacylglyceryl transferase
VIRWDPSPELLPFNIPFLGRPILWYGFLFALGFCLAYVIILTILKKDLGEKKAKFLAEKLSLYVIVGTIIGAKLGDFFFYQDWRDPLSFFKIWERGLASHGGVAGILVALFIFLKKHRKTLPTLSWRKLLDWLSVPAGLVGACIRVGNFINQEILGQVTDVPWAVVFGHPIDGSLPCPRHPVQLYEAAFYLFIFGVCFCLYRKKKWREGRLAGFFLTTVFSFRFLIEFLKEEQSSWMPAHAFIDMGQLLSVPLILFGLYLFFNPLFSSSK